MELNNFVPRIKKMTKEKIFFFSLLLYFWHQVHAAVVDTAQYEK